jgi:cation diffusion facilitator CzcD-associated flavoprotein CzcO
VLFFWLSSRCIVRPFQNSISGTGPGASTPGSLTPDEGPQKSGRVLMDHLMKLVTTALEWSYVEAEIDVSPKHLQAAAEQLTLRRDAIYLVDGTGQKKEEQVTSEGQTSEAKVQNPK